MVPCVGGTNAYLREKRKVSIFENGHLLFDKNNFFLEKKTFYPDKQELCHFEKKKHFPLYYMLNDYWDK